MHFIIIVKINNKALRNATLAYTLSKLWPGDELLDIKANGTQSHNMFNMLPNIQKLRRVCQKYFFLPARNITMTRELVTHLIFILHTHTKTGSNQNK